MDALVQIDGRICRPEEAKVSVFDRGFLFGDGVYETGKSRERCLLHLGEHVGRLRKSAGKLDIRYPWTDAELGERVGATARAFGRDEISFRLIVTRGVVERVALGAEAVGKPTVVVMVQPIPSENAEKRKRGVKLVTSTIVRNSVLAQDPDIKTSNYLNSLLALHDAKRRGGDDAILCDARGNVTEGTTFSVFGVTAEGALVTPARSVGILDSLTRRHLIELAGPDIPVREVAEPVSAFLACRELFIASSVRGVMPVAAWDGRAFPVPGPVTAELARRLDRADAAYVAAHPKF